MRDAIHHDGAAGAGRGDARGATLRATLGAVAAELLDAHAIALEIQDMLGRVIAGQGATLDELQALDGLTQTLADVAAFTGTLAADGPDLAIDRAAAARGLRQRAVADRLAGLSLPADPSLAGPGSGHADFFGPSPPAAASG